jgi:hypothetical protein
METVCESIITLLRITVHSTFPSALHGAADGIGDELAMRIVFYGHDDLIAEYPC